MCPMAKATLCTLIIKGIYLNFTRPSTPTCESRMKKQVGGKAQPIKGARGDAPPEIFWKFDCMRYSLTPF